MKARTLVSLLAVAVALAGLAYLSAGRRGRLGAASERVGAYVLPVLRDDDKLGGVERILVESAGSTVVVTRVEDRWVAPGKHNYPADFDKISGFVRTLRDLKVGQLLPPSADAAAKLQLVRPGQAGTNAAQEAGTLVRLEDSQGREVASLLIGKERHKQAAGGDMPFASYGGYADGRFIMADGQAYLVGETFGSLPSKAKDWMNDELANEYSSDLTGIRVTEADGKELVLSRADGGDLKVDGLAEDEEMDATKVNSLAGLLSYLRFEDTADPELTDAAMGFDKPLTYVARTKAGKIYTLTAGAGPTNATDRYVRLSVGFEAPAEPAAEKAAEGAGETAAVKSEPVDAAKAEADKKKADREKLAKDVHDQNAKLAGWTYLIRSYKLDTVKADRGAIVKKKEKKEEAPKAETAAVEQGAPAATNAPAQPVAAVTNAPAPSAAAAPAPPPVAAPQPAATSTGAAPSTAAADVAPGDK